MQTSFEAVVNRLREQLADQTDEHQLHRYLTAALAEFEAEYRQDRQPFSAQVIDLLRIARSCCRAVQDFIETCDDISDVRSREEAAELRDHLREISAQLEHCAVRARVEKEYRELSEKLVELPSISEAGAETQLMRRVAELNGDPPDCHKCGSSMVLHVGRSTAFWGCSTFPKCYRRKWLTRSQRSRLEIE